jgi:hypothetical protein
MADRRQDGARATGSFDGRLDLDALDDGRDPTLDLDVIGDDRPTLRESLARRLEDSGLRPFVTRHRRAFTAAAVVAALVVVSGTVWWLRRPDPLPAPQLVARVAGAEPTAALVQDVDSGVYTGIQQRLLLAGSEPPGVALRLLGIAGPGLVVDPRGPGVPADAGPSGSALTVGARLSCITPEATTAELSSSADDYALVVRRASPEGEIRDYRVPLVGSLTLVGLVHRACLQIALDRDLVVSSVTAAPYPGVVALALDVDLSNASPRVWTGLHVAAAAQPVVLNDGPQVQLEPGTSGHLRAQFWPEDCADPVRALRDGVAVEADLGPTGRDPSQGPTSTSALLRLPGQMLDDVAAQAVAMCGTTPPKGTVDWARLREGGGNGSGGVIDLGLSLTTPRAGIVEVDHLGDGSASVGELFAYESPVHSVDGVASIKAQWRLPSCRVLLRDGLPRLHVVLAGDVRRPYLVPLAGDDLRQVLYRLCGSEIADLVG